MYVRGLTLAMVAGEPMVVFWCLEDLGAALAAADDMGLPVTSPESVEEELLRLLWPHRHSVTTRASHDRRMGGAGHSEGRCRPFSGHFGKATGRRIASNGRSRVPEGYG